jgi:hypothetical protein
MAFGKCPRAATLSAKHEHNSGSRGTREGTIGHAFCELYYGGQKFEPNEVIFTPKQDPAEVEEMERVWLQYRDKFPRDEWGEILSIEEHLSGPEVENAVGIAPYTGKVDFVCKLGDEESILRLVDSRPGLRNAPLKPGMVLGGDHKFLSRRNSNQEDKYIQSLQFTGYQLAYNAVHPEQPCEGWIVNTVIKTKTVQFYTMFVPPPTEKQIKALRDALHYWKFLKEEFPEQTNPLEDYCFGYVDPCWWLRQGMCDRGAGGDLIQIKRRLEE